MNPVCQGRELCFYPDLQFCKNQVSHLSLLFSCIKIVKTKRTDFLCHVLSNIRLIAGVLEVAGDQEIPSLRF